MVANKQLTHPAALATFLLGQASIWWGLVVAVAYNVGFAILLPRLGQPASASSMGLSLPMAFPLIGLAFAALGLMLARRGGRAAIGYPIAGLVVNTVPLTFAIILRVVGH